MSSESEAIKPKTGFELILNYSNQCIRKKLKNNSGAGANATSRVDKTFSAIDPLSEIVWSADKGFSLRCVDSSFTNKNSSLFGNVEPSSMVLALLQNVTGGSSTTDKPIDDVFVEPITVICQKYDVSSTDTPAKHPISDSAVIIPDHKIYEENHDIGSGVNMEKTNTARGAPNLPNGQTKNSMNDRENNTCSPANIGISEIKGNKSATISGQADQRPVNNLILQADEPKSSMERNPSPRKHCNGGTYSAIVNQGVEIEDDLYPRVEHRVEYKGSGALAMNLTSAFSPSQKLESTAEDDLQTFDREATYAATSEAFVSKSNENENKPQVNETMQLCNKNLPVLHSPCNSVIHMTSNEGKQKSLSDGDGDSNVNLSKEENDCHLSVESCRSSGLFLAGKKRCNFQQQVMFGRKKVKKQIQEISYSKAYVKPDSSFMNLFSNMMRRCSQSTQDEDKSLAFTHENPDCHLQWSDQKPLTYSKNQDPELKDAGFRSNFQSMSCPRFKKIGTRMSHQIGEASKDFELGNKVHGIDATPITFYAENNSLYGQHFQTNKFDVYKVRDDACPSLQPHTRPINSLNSHEHRKNNSFDNENSYNLELSKEKEGMTLLSLHSPSARHNKNNNDNVESCALYERKKICHKNDTLGGLWITRFSRKSTSPLIIYDHLNERGSFEVHKHVSLNNCKIEETRHQSVDEQLLSEGKRLQDCCTNKETSTSLMDDIGDNVHKSKHKFYPTTPFPGMRDSEPMVSMFARRLGAIKQCQLTE